MKASLIGLVICITAVYFGDKLSDMRTIKLPDQEMAKLHTLCDQQAITDGFPNSVIKVTEIKIARVKTKQYTFKYYYEVNGASYNTEVTTVKEPNGDPIKIWYD